MADYIHYSNGDVDDDGRVYPGPGYILRYDPVSKKHYWDYDPDLDEEQVKHLIGDD